MTAFPIPQGIPTHVTLGELRLLQEFAHEAGTVLEIGTYLGFTCIGMALAGAHVTSVDPHVHDAAGRISTWEEFLDNCEHYWLLRERPYRDRLAYAGPITAMRIRIEDADFPPTIYRFGLVFIDGDHVWPAPMRDARIALAHMQAPGFVAMHDVTPNWPGVWRTHCELTASGELDQVACERYLRVYRARGYQSSASGVCGKSSTPSVAE